VQALVFSWSRHWCFCVLAPLFFRGRKSASRAEKPKNADAWTRWTSKRVLSAISFENARLCDGFKPTSPRGRARATTGRRQRTCVRPGRAARPRHAGAERERVDRQRLTEPGVRQSSGALAAWYRWQHSSKDGAAGSTTTTDYYAYRLALEQQQARTRGGVAAILRELRPASAEKLEAPGNGRAGGARRASRAGWRGSRADGV